MKKFWKVILFVLCLDCYAGDLSLLSWNVETFFDGINDGSEYTEFLKSTKWNESTYKKRVDNLCQALKILDSDIVVLIELENKGVLYDISNCLQDLSWKRKKLYGYSCFSKNEGAGIGLGVLSRYEIKDFSVHNIDVQDSGKQPSMRPILKVLVDVNGKELDLFVNHWKSMSGGQEETEVWRNWQESVLSSLIRDEINAGKLNVVAAGDFNRDINNFYREGSFSGADLTGLRHFTGKRNEFDYAEEVHSVWFDNNGKLLEPGSYWFNSEWSRIDQIFYSGKIKVEKFEAVQNELWCNENGTPCGYAVYAGKGFSDHLPLKCTFKLAGDKQ